MTSSPAAAFRASPMHALHVAKQPTWGTLEGVRVVSQFADESEHSASILGIADASAFTRVGLKGPGAPDWLRSQGIAVPPNANQWMPLGTNGLIARLGRTEFLIEDQTLTPTIVSLRQSLRERIDSVYPVPRSDCALCLVGNRVNELFVQTCNVDFAAQRASDQVVTLTQMIGVSVTVLHEASHHRWRIWCDGTFGPYFWETLVEIGKELEGGAIGLRRAYPSLSLA